MLENAREDAHVLIIVAPHYHLIINNDNDLCHC